MAGGSHVSTWTTGLWLNACHGCQWVLPVLRCQEKRNCFTILNIDRFQYFENAELPELHALLVWSPYIPISHRRLRWWLPLSSVRLHICYISWSTSQNARCFLHLSKMGLLLIIFTALSAASTQNFNGCSFSKYNSWYHINNVVKHPSTLAITCLVISFIRLS